MTTDLQISLAICADSLGDYCEGEEQKYANAMEKAIQEEYPLADISVEIEYDTAYGGSIHVTGESDTNDLHAIHERVRELEQYVWERVDWRENDN